MLLAIEKKGFAALRKTLVARSKVAKPPSSARLEGAGTGVGAGPTAGEVTGAVTAGDGCLCELGVIGLTVGAC